MAAGSEHVLGVERGYMSIGSQESNASLMVEAVCSYKETHDFL